LVAAAAVLGVVLAAGGASHPPGRPRAAARGSATLPPGAPLPRALPASGSQLVADLERAQQIIDDPSSTTAQLASAGAFEQLATFELARQPPRVRHTSLAGLDGQAVASIRANLAAAEALGRLVTPRRSLPPWKIVQPPAPPVLLGYFKAAQRRFGVPWEYLAAIEFIETKFGRVNGLSSAGARGPMQFLPATWARYGTGDVHAQRDAILGAARYLVASGAPGDMAGALYHYNPSGDYVSAVKAYAGRMFSDHRSYFGYYYWQVIYAHVGGPLILPVGYPRVRPIPLGYPGR
jgi:hypothetical protein